MSKASRSRRAWVRYKNGGGRGMNREMRSYSRWIKSMGNLKVVDSNGFAHWAFDRPVLIKNGGKP